MARAMVTASGDLTRNGAANFLNLASDPRDLSEYAADILLGTQIACARCHAHPNDRWTTDDYYQFAAIFSKVSRDDNVIGVNPRGSIDLPKSNVMAEPKLLGGSKISLAESDSREALAQWMTDPKNPSSLAHL